MRADSDSSDLNISPFPVSNHSILISSNAFAIPTSNALEGFIFLLSTSDKVLGEIIVLQAKSFWLSFLYFRISIILSVILLVVMSILMRFL